MRNQTDTDNQHEWVKGTDVTLPVLCVFNMLPHLTFPTNCEVVKTCYIYEEIIQRKKVTQGHLSSTQRDSVLHPDLWPRNLCLPWEFQWGRLHSDQGSVEALRVRVGCILPGYSGVNRIYLEGKFKQCLQQKQRCSGVEACGNGHEVISTSAGQIWNPWWEMDWKGRLWEDHVIPQALAKADETWKAKLKKYPC